MKVSIVIPTFNRPDYLSRLLDSIARQTFKDYEVIVVDDNSPNSAEYSAVIDYFQAKLPALTYLRNTSNMGAPYSRNRGIETGRFELIALVDDDDEWLDEKLAKQVEIFSKADDRLGLVYTWTDAVDETGAVVYRYRSTIKGNAIKEILQECFIPSPSVMVRASAIKKAGLFDVTFPSCQDWEMWTRILKAGYHCNYVDDVVTIYHKHNTGSIGLGQKAKIGYSKYYKKNLFSIIKYCKFRLLLRAAIFILKA